jgi:hypothetical protein
VAGQDESVDLARPAPLCPLGCQWQVTFFGYWGSLTLPAPLDVSGGWDNYFMDKVAKSLLIRPHFVAFGLTFLNFAYQDQVQ